MTNLPRVQNNNGQPRFDNRDQQPKHDKPMHTPDDPANNLLQLFNPGYTPMDIDRAMAAIEVLIDKPNGAAMLQVIGTRYHQIDAMIASIERDILPALYARRDDLANFYAQMQYWYAAPVAEPSKKK